MQATKGLSYADIQKLLENYVLQNETKGGHIQEFENTISEVANITHSMQQLMCNVKRIKEHKQNELKCLHMQERGSYANSPKQNAEGKCSKKSSNESNTLCRAKNSAPKPQIMSEMCNPILSEVPTSKSIHNSIPKPYNAQQSNLVTVPLLPNFQMPERKNSDKIIASPTQISMFPPNELLNLIKKDTNSDLSNQSNSNKASETFIAQNQDMEIDKAPECCQGNTLMQNNNNANQNTQEIAITKNTNQTSKQPNETPLQANIIPIENNNAHLNTEAGSINNPYFAACEKKPLENPLKCQLDQHTTESLEPSKRITPNFNNPDTETNKINTQEKFDQIEAIEKIDYSPFMKPPSVCQIIPNFQKDNVAMSSTNKAFETPMKLNQTPALSEKLSKFMSNKHIHPTLQSIKIEELDSVYQRFLNNKTQYQLTESDLESDKDYDSDYFEEEVDDEAVLSDNPEANSIKGRLLAKNNTLAQSNKKARKIMTRQHNPIAQWAQNKDEIEKVIICQMALINPDEVFNPKPIENLDIYKITNVDNEQDDHERGSSACWKNDQMTPLNSYKDRNFQLGKELQKKLYMKFNEM